MPEDCIISYDYDGRLDEISRTKAYDLYAQTSYLGDLGKRGTDGDVVQSFEYKVVPEDLDLSDHAIGIGGADYDLF